MACDISLGRIEPCKDSVSGLKNCYFVNFGKITGVPDGRRAYFALNARRDAPV